MPNESTKRDLERLEHLSPEARARVDSAFKAAIEREVVVGEIGPAAAGNIFSRGWIFSRLTPTAMAELKSLPELEKMNAEQFAEFATRLSEMKARIDPRRLE